MEKPTPKISRRNVLRWGAAGLVTTTAIGIHESPLTVTEKTFRLPRWKADGFRIAQVSDAHVYNHGQMLVAQEAVRLAVASKPDLFVFTGDFLNYDDFSMENIVPAFEALHDLRCPALAVLGNHDYLSGAVSKIAARVAKTPMKLLVNQAFEMPDVRIVGLDDGDHGHPDYSLLDKAAPSTVTLLHEPDYSEHLPATGGIVLSGHSHGGEVCLPGGVPLYTPPGARRYKSGYYGDAPTPVFVNRGTATLGFYRVFCPPEVAILTLRGA